MIVMFIYIDKDINYNDLDVIVYYYIDNNLYYYKTYIDNNNIKIDNLKNIKISYILIDQRIIINKEKLIEVQI